MARNQRRPPAPDPVEELIQVAIDLDLTTAAEQVRVLLNLAQDGSMSYTDFALALLRTEAQARMDRHLTRSLKRSCLGTVEGIDGYDFTVRPQLEPRVVRELLTCQYVEEKRNILCLGKPGLGKTRIAKTLLYAACVAGYSTLCVGTAEMLEQLHASHADASFKRALRRYVKPQVLLLDEFGYEPFDSQATAYLFRLVSARHGQGSTILTANTGFSQWKRLFPSEAQAIATVDRLVDRATILRFTGKTFRNPLEISGAPLD